MNNVKNNVRLTSSPNAIIDESDPIFKEYANFIKRAGHIN